MGEGSADPFPLDPNDPDALPPRKPRPPEPLVDEEVLAVVLRELVEAYLNEYPYLIWRNSIGYVARVDGKLRKMSRRTYTQTVAHHMAKNGYERRGILYDLVSERVREKLAARDL